MGDYKTEYDAQSNVVVVQHVGLWNRDESNETLEWIFAACREHGTDRVLIDHRETRIELDTFGLFERGRELAEPDRMPPVTRLAFVCARDKGEDYAFMTMVMTNRGMQVRTFPDDMAAAYAWLAGD